MNGDGPVQLPIDGFLDLHAFDPRDVPNVVRDYVEAAHAEGLTEIRIVHGRGSGVLRGIVQATLDAHPLVEAFWDDHESRLGATGVRLARNRDSGFGIRDSGSDDA
ncbi:MAG: Smr/MutS family protein [Acidobacteriota bacterium]